MNVLEVKNVTKIYGGRYNQTVALDGVTFNIEKGEFIGIMGPSGSGKTTLLNVVSTIDKATSGSIMVNEKDILKLKNTQLADFRGRELGFIFQDFNLLETLTLYENIALPLSLAKKNYKTIKQRIKEVSDLLGISDILNKYPYEVSGGQKQRAAAVRAMIMKPALILADEPTGALDSKNARKLLETMKHMNKKLNATIMLVTHDAFSASYCDRILFLNDGKIFTEIVSTGNRKEMFHKVLDVLTVLGGDKDVL